MNTHIRVAIFLAMVCAYQPLVITLHNVPTVDQAQQLQHQATNPVYKSLKERMTKKLASCKNYIKKHSSNIILVITMEMIVLAAVVIAHKNRPPTVDALQAETTRAKYAADLQAMQADSDVRKNQLDRLDNRLTTYYRYIRALQRDHINLLKEYSAVLQAEGEYALNPRNMNRRRSI